MGILEQYHSWEDVDIYCPVFDRRILVKCEWGTTYNLAVLISIFITDTREKSNCVKNKTVKVVGEITTCIWALNLIHG